MGRFVNLSEMPETVISSGRWQPLNERLGIRNFGYGQWITREAETG